MILVALLTACGKKADIATTKHDGGVARPATPAIALPPLGVDRINRFNFPWAEGGPSYDKAMVAYKAKTRDWAAVRAGCEAAVAKDPTHLDAQYLLAVALADAGDHAAAVDHVVAAIAGDYYQYGASFATDPEFEAFRATPQGHAVAALVQQIHDEYATRIKTGVWLVGRRTTFKWPAKDGVQFGSSRGELYAYDRETRRYFRLTHTDHQVAGFVRSPSGGEVALIGFDKIDRPKADTTAPSFARAWLEAVDPIEWKLLGPRINLAPARVVAAAYGDGDQLLAASAPATGRWTIGDWTTWSVDRTTGKLASVAQSQREPRVEVTLDEGRSVRPQAIAGIDASWTGDPPTAPALKIGKLTIQVPESGQAAHDTVALSPDGAHVAFATAVDPCAKDAAPSLYVADAKSGALKHILTAKSRFATRWIDATTLAYDDGDGAIRLWDAMTGRESLRLDNKSGLALDVLSVASAPLCKQAPPAVQTGSGSGDEPLPPEEGSAVQ